MATQDKLVSIIIPTTKGDKHLADCIKSIKDSTYKNIEIIVVDENLERSAQRNIGFKRAHGEYILTLDSDMTIEPLLIHECVYGMEKRKLNYDGLYIPEIITGKGFWIRVRNFERSFYNGTRIDAIRFLKREYWQNFDENLTGVEDWDWDRRFKGNKGITYYSVFHNEKVFNLRRYLFKKKYYAQWLNLYKKKYPNCPELNLWYRYFGVFIENGKWKKLIRHPVLTLAMYFLLFAKGVVYLWPQRKF